MRVVIAEAAEADIETIADWIAEDSPKRARSFAAELRSACKGTGNAPRAYPVVLRRTGTQIRRRPVRGYLIFYEITREAVVILRVLHGGRDYEAIFSASKPQG